MVELQGFSQEVWCKLKYRPKDDAMAERLVDVSNGSRTAVLHTFPITIGGSDIAAKDAEYEEKALKAAAYAQLVPDADLKGLTTRMHVSRGGALEPYGDDRDVLSQTKQGLDQVVRERAYFLWEQEGCPEGRGDEYWHRAHHQHLCERAYVLWQQEGCPEGEADGFWHRTREFETR
jgi:Protein of unknown function (DUF2934)